MQRLYSFLRLPRTERHLLIAAAVILAMIKVGLSLVSFKTFLAILERVAKARRTASRPSSDRIVWAVTVAGRYIPHTSTCLVQALAAQVLLRRRCYPARLQIGVGKGPDHRLQAHAWLESGGRIVIGDLQAEGFITLPAMKLSTYEAETL